MLFPAHSLTGTRDDPDAHLLNSAARAGSLGISKASINWGKNPSPRWQGRLTAHRPGSPQRLAKALTNNDRDVDAHCPNRTPFRNCAQVCPVSSIWQSLITPPEMLGEVRPFVLVATKGGGGYIFSSWPGSSGHQQAVSKLILHSPHPFTGQQ
jgi:hypothetical protein